MIAQPKTEAGTVSIMFAVLGFGILMSLALVVDGGRQLAALSEAQDLADNAARSGAQQVDPEEWRRTGQPLLNQAEAEASARDLLASRVASGRVRSVAITFDSTGTEITVELTVQRQQFLIPQREATGIGTADAQDGVLVANP